VTLVLSATVFESLMLKARKWLNFPTPPLFEATARRGGGLECRDEIWRQKTRIAWLPDSEEIMIIISACSVTSRLQRRRDDIKWRHSDVTCIARSALNDLRPVVSAESFVSSLFGTGGHRIARDGFLGVSLSQ